MDIIRHTVMGLLVAACMGIIGANLAPSEDRARLLQDLFTNYVKSVAPSSEGEPVKVNHKIMAASVVSLENNILQLFIWNDMSWNDDRLRWKPAEYGNVTKMSIPSSMIWLPDIVVMESIDPYNGFPNRNVNALISSNGGMTFIPPELVKASCPFDADTLYVDNTVECKLTFLSWTHDCSELDFRPQSENIADNYLRPSDNRWQIKSIHVERNEKVYSCCPETYCDVTYTFAIKRVA